MSNAKAVALKKHNFGDDTKVGYLLLAPWLFGFIFMYVIPAAMSIYYSFTDYNLLSAPNWVGLKNYITIFTTDKTFRKALVVTFSYVFIMVPLRLAFALFVATLLNKKHMGMAFYRVLYYIPSIVGGSIAVSVVWKQIFGNKGVLMSLLSAIGIEQKFSLLGNPKTALFVIVLMGVWQFGSCMLVFLSGLKQIPNSLYESASLDGASKMQQFWKITMPMKASRPQMPCSSTHRRNFSGSETKRIIGRPTNQHSSPIKTTSPKTVAMPHIFFWRSVICIYRPSCPNMDFTIRIPLLGTVCNKRTMKSSLIISYERPGSAAS